MGRYYVLWGDGVLELVLDPTAAKVRGGNVTIGFEPRQLSVEGVEAEVEVHQVGTKRMYCYVVLKEPITPLKGYKFNVIHGFSRYVDGFEVRFTDLGFSRFLTLVTPGAWLYNYVIISDDRITCELSIRREVYVEKEDGVTRVYVV